MASRSPDLPLAARVLDVVATVGVLLALTVYVTGGFREWTPFGRVSITSWLRPLLVGLAAIAARHWWYPRPTIVSRVNAWRRRVAAVPGVRVALPIAIGSRLGVLLAGFFAVVLMGYRTDVPVPWRVYENEWLNLPARWDTGWYLAIATEGYRWEASSAAEQQNIAFFPVFPLLMRYLSLLVGREMMWTGVLISVTAFSAALVYQYRLGRDRLGEDAAAGGVALLACYPFALFFSAAYTEGLFLLMIVAAFYHFERNELWRAALWGLGAGLTRPNGSVLSVALFIMALRPLWPLPKGGLRAGDWARIADRVAVAAMPGIGMLLYSTYIFFLTGHPLQWAAQNAAWGRVYRGLDELVSERAAWIGDQGLYTYAATQTLDALQLAAVLLVAASVVPVWRRLGGPYAVLLIVNLVPPLLMGGLLSIGRVTSVLFPTFLWLGAAVPAAHRPAWLAVFAMLQAICAALFFTWRPLF